MKRIGILVLLLALSLLLVACGGDDDVPDGMQLVAGGEELGYYFYVPEEWTVANQGEVKVAFASNLDTTSASFARAEAPIGSLNDYFTESLEKLGFATDVKLMGEKCDFGNAEPDEAYKYIYEYKFEDFDFRTMQILIARGEDFYIFTFTSQLTERTEGESYYDFYSEKLQSIIKNFKFCEKESQKDAAEYPEVDGYLLVSDKKASGFDFYIPKGWDVRYSESNVGISKADGASVNITKATAAGVGKDTYFKGRCDEIMAITGSPVTETPGKIGIETALGNSKWAFSYDYTYNYGDTTYRVYQIIAVYGIWPFQKGYVFTYTAPQDVFEEHIEEVLKMAEKVNFR